MLVKIFFAPVYGYEDWGSIAGARWIQPAFLRVIKNYRRSG